MSRRGPDVFASHPLATRVRTEASTLSLIPDVRTVQAAYGTTSQKYTQAPLRIHHVIPRLKIENPSTHNIVTHT